MQKLNISGAVVVDLVWDHGRLKILGENDHLLRRFGQIDVARLSPHEPRETLRESGADEIWVLMGGEANVVLTDLRADSPTKTQFEKVQLHKGNPQAVVIPFGVKALVFAQVESTLLRITSHADDLTPHDKNFQSAGQG